MKIRVPSLNLCSVHIEYLKEKIIEYLKLEGVHKDHHVQLPGPRRLPKTEPYD